MSIYPLITEVAKSRGDRAGFGGRSRKLPALHCDEDSRRAEGLCLLVQHRCVWKIRPTDVRPSRSVGVPIEADLIKFLTKNLDFVWQLAWHNAFRVKRRRKSSHPKRLVTSSRHSHIFDLKPT